MLRRIPSTAVLLAVILALTAGCGGFGSPTPPAARPVIDVPQLEERALLLLLAERRVYEPYTAGQALSGDADLRRFLALTLGRIAEPEGRRVLEGLLLDEAAPVRRAAAFALGQQGDPEAIRPLLAAVEGGDRATAAEAVAALGRLGADLAEVLEALSELPEAERWARLLPGLFRFDDLAVLVLAAEGLEQPAPELRRAAAFALTHRPRRQALPLLRDLLAAPEPRLAAWAAEAVGPLGDGSDLPRLRPLLDAEAAAPVIRALAAGRQLVRRGVAAPPDDWRARLSELLADPRPAVRLAALEAADAWLLDDELGAALVARVEGEVPPALSAVVGSVPMSERGRALVALAEALHPRALDLTAQLAAAAEPPARAWAARAAGRLAATYPNAADLLARLVEDDDPRVRLAAYGVLLGDDPTGAAPLVRAALTDTDPAVRTQALAWLTRHPLLPFEEVDAALAGLRSSEVVEGRLAVVRALAARGAATSLERGSVVALLEQLAGDPDPLLRRAAADGLVLLDRPVPAVGAAGPGRDISVYRQIVQRTAQPRTVELATVHGPLRLRLDCPQTPLTCLNFLQLAELGFYDGLPFYHLEGDGWLAGGDPRGDGWGGPGYTQRSEPSAAPILRGTLYLPALGPDAAGSRFQLALAPRPELVGEVTVLGQLVAGEEVLERLEEGDVLQAVVEVP